MQQAGGHLNSPHNAHVIPERPTARLADLITGVSHEMLGEDVIAVVKRLALDGIAVAIAGTVEAPPKIMADYVRDVGATPKSSVWGFNFKTSPALAAYANAVSMHVLDF